MNEHLSFDTKAKIAKNEKENASLKKNIHDLLSGDKILASRPIIIGKTPLSLAICGADTSLDLTITKSVVTKCLRPEIRDAEGRLVKKTGHGLTEAQLTESLNNIKTPMMIFKGSRENTLIAVTNLKDKLNREIIVSIELEQKENFHKVNKITSVYGRKDFGLYYDRQLENRQLLAINIEEADALFRSIRKKYPQENTFISFDNSIAYTTENVTF